MSTSNNTSSSSATGSSDTLSALPQPSTVPPNYFTTYNSDFPLVNPNGQFTLFNWKNTSSSLQHKPFTGRTPPTTSSPNSMFLDRKSNPRIHDEHILSFFRNDLLGVAFFPSDQFIQLTFKDETTFHHYLSNPQISINEKTIHLSPPRSHPRTTLVLHLHGLPIIPASAISSAISSALSPFCTIKEIAPVYLKDTTLLTPKWDVVVSPIPSKTIPVQLTLFDTSIALTWANSSPICLHCHSTEHINKDCPTRPQPHPKQQRTYAQIISNSKPPNNSTVTQQPPASQPLSVVTTPIQPTPDSSPTNMIIDQAGYSFEPISTSTLSSLSNHNSELPSTPSSSKRIKPNIHE